MYQRRYTNCVVLPIGSTPGTFLQRKTCCLCHLCGNGVDENCEQVGQPGKNSAQLLPEESRLADEAGLPPWTVIPFCIFNVGSLEIPKGSPSKGENLREMTTEEKSRQWRWAWSTMACQKGRAQNKKKQCVTSLSLTGLRCTLTTFINRIGVQVLDNSGCSAREVAIISYGPVPPDSVYMFYISSIL